MTSRISPAAVAALLALVGGTAWITRHAKALETDQDDAATRVTLLGKRAPDFRLTSLDGRTVSLSDYLGKKKLVLIFWASWNNGSHPAMLALNVFYRTVHKPDSDFDIAAISVDDSRADAQKFVTDSKMTYPVLLASRDLATGTFGIRRVPTVILIDTSGKVEFGLAGYTPRVIPDLSQRLGINDYRMEFGGPNGRRN